MCIFFLDALKNININQAFLKLNLIYIFLFSVIILRLVIKYSIIIHFILQKILDHRKIINKYYNY